MSDRSNRLQQAATGCGARRRRQMSTGDAGLCGGWRRGGLRPPSCNHNSEVCRVGGRRRRKGNCAGMADCLWAQRFVCLAVAAGGIKPPGGRLRLRVLAHGPGGSEQEKLRIVKMRMLGDCLSDCWRFPGANSPIASHRDAPRGGNCFVETGTRRAVLPETGGFCRILCAALYNPLTGC